MTDIELAKSVFQSDRYAFVLVRDGRVIAAGTRDGIGELLEAVETYWDELRGATLADKIVGKAVALVAAYASIGEIYTPLGSEAANQVLDAYHIAFHAERIVPLIRNKMNNGPCPMERLTMPLNEPIAAVQALQDFFAQRRAAVPT